MNTEDLGRSAPIGEIEASRRNQAVESQTSHPTRRTLASARRIVVKIGSALIVDETSGTIKESWLETLAEDIARLRGRGQDVTVVSSGAVAIGRHVLDLRQKTLSRADRQAAAAVGQIHLARAYWETFARHGLTAAQILITLDDTTERQRLLNFRATLVKLLTFQTVPVLNENDAVAGSLPSYGENDRLAARTARLIGSDTLVLLSNVAGLYTADPNESSSAMLITEVHDVTPEIQQMAGGARSSYSSGGMMSKLAAARFALAFGCTVIIADGRDARPLSAIEADEPCTWFHPSAAARSARRTWIAGILKPVGFLVADSSAAMQLRLGRDLCLEGVISLGGNFARGDAIVIRNIEGDEVARGLSIHSSTELRCLTRRSRPEAVSALAYSRLNQVVHRDDLALTE